MALLVVVLTEVVVPEVVVVEPAFVVGCDEVMLLRNVEVYAVPPLLKVVVTVEWEVDWLVVVEWRLPDASLVMLEMTEEMALTRLDMTPGVVDVPVAVEVAVVVAVVAIVVVVPAEEDVWQRAYGSPEYT